MSLIMIIKIKRRKKCQPHDSSSSCQPVCCLLNQALLEQIRPGGGCGDGDPASLSRLHSLLNNISLVNCSIVVHPFSILTSCIAAGCSEHSPLPFSTFACPHVPLSCSCLSRSICPLPKLHICTLRSTLTVPCSGCSSELRMAAWNRRSQCAT